MTNILILEDLPDAQRWLREAVEMAFPDAEVRACSRLETARATLGEFTPELCLVDLRLPDGSGLEFLRECRAEHPNSLLIVTTIYDDDIHVFPALQAGADGYLLKEESRASIAAALRTAVDGGAPAISANISRLVLRHFNRRGDAVRSSRPVLSCSADTLSPREMEVLALIAEGQTVSKAAETLGVSYHTAARHVKNLYSKLAITSRAEAVREAIRLGLFSTDRF